MGMLALSNHYLDKMEGSGFNFDSNAGAAQVPVVEPLSVVVARLGANLARAVTHGVQAVQENNAQLLEIRQTIASALPQTAGGWSSGSSGGVIPGRRGRRVKKGKKADYVNTLHVSDLQKRMSPPTLCLGSDTQACSRYSRRKRRYNGTSMARPNG
jgi:hypothetical protein